MTKANIKSALERFHVAQTTIYDGRYIKKGDQVEVDLSNYLTKADAASLYVTKDNLQIILGTDTSTTEGAIWLEWG